MAAESFKPLKGHCACKTITYEVLAPFLCTHCCHCTWCQRETGSAFALNAFVETYNFRITSETKPICVDTPTASGNGQMMARCPKCYVVLYSDYGGDGTWWIAVRVGSLDDEGKSVTKPDIHIFTTTKLDWVDLTSERGRGVPIMDGFYKRHDVWRKEALDRFDVLSQKMKEVDKTEGAV